MTKSLILAAGAAVTLLTLSSCEVVEVPSGPAPYGGYSSQPVYMPPQAYAPSTPYYQSGYYPYSAPPARSEKVSDAQRRQHAYDVGYRVGQDDFHRGLDKHYVRHPDLYDSDTRDGFKDGYESGYDRARDHSNRR